MVGCLLSRLGRPPSTSWPAPHADRGSRDPRSRTRPRSSAPYERVPFPRARARLVVAPDVSSGGGRASRTSASSRSSDPAARRPRDHRDLRRRRRIGRRTKPQARGVEASSADCPPRCSPARWRRPLCSSPTSTRLRTRAPVAPVTASAALRSLDVPAGSMGPKVGAVCQFVEAGGR
jgi:hypothetical protein